MADTLTLRVITPERIVLDTSAACVSFPATDGLIGVLPRHAPMVAALDAGSLTYSASRDSSESEVLFVSGGFAEVRDNTVRVVTEASEPAGEIDIERATKAAERARERLEVRAVADEPISFDRFRAQASLRRALMRRFVANKARQ